MVNQHREDNKHTIKFSWIIIQLLSGYDRRRLREYHLIATVLKSGIHFLIGGDVKVNSAWRLTVDYDLVNSSLILKAKHTHQK